MATAFSSSSPSPHHNFFTYSNSKTLYSDSLQPLIYSPLHPHRPSLPIRLRSRRLPRCLSAGPGPPSQPDSDPPPSPVNATDQEFLLPQSDTIEGFVGKLFSFQDRMRIFFAVLFWMSLFFWSSAWNRRNSGRPNKGSRFRR